MITLILLHPTQLLPVQQWSFESKTLIRIGRARDNDIIIYSAVVSRHHLELWEQSTGWKIINFGANGTYLNNESIIETSAVDGMIIRLGNSGPKLQIFTRVIVPKIPETNPDIPQEKITLINKNHLHKNIDKNTTINQDITQTEFD